RLRVRPYYLHHPDLTAGTGHFRVPLERGRHLVAYLQRVLPGLAVPHYVVDLPGGRGKVPVAAEHVESLGATAIVRAPDGEKVEVPNE
ncbi:MAG: lysine 2,3-aminomutase, partial [Desulfuromonadales bacterium]|nr:lysine 2,3-aminomutase [Desulfuromonadales bacterium]NIS42876.1 lysine 2,3-aminomutase [Desulfuromonadales bacterium]